MLDEHGADAGYLTRLEAFADILREEGLRIARRTVAKYREQLGVLPARLRTEF